eukprot:GHRQ01021041.1.p2 GENE.GHRQ01021041.1~~GHRQ01021041.1.p2  ORF type:complete len:126 (+),score=18.20 GHRQ01021041.1:546-923(+)
MVQELAQQLHRRLGPVHLQCRHVKVVHKDNRSAAQRRAVHAFAPLVKLGVNDVLHLAAAQQGTAGCSFRLRTLMWLSKNSLGHGGICSDPVDIAGSKYCAGVAASRCNAGTAGERILCRYCCHQA